MSDETTQAEGSEWGEWGSGPVDDRPTPGAGDGVLSGAPAVLFQPQPVQHRENHAFTLSMQVGGKDSPMLVLRAETAAELNNMITQVEMAGLWANVGSHLSTARAHGTLGAGMPGQVQAAPMAQQPVPQVTPQGIPMNPAAQYGPPLGAGGAPGTAPAQWQNAGAPAAAAGGCMGLPQGWFKVNIPYQSRAAGDAIKEQLKAQGLYQGNMKWCGGAKHWHVSPNVVGAFGQFGPTQ